MRGWPQVDKGSNKASRESDISTVTGRERQHEQGEETHSEQMGTLCTESLDSGRNLAYGIFIWTSQEADSEIGSQRRCRKHHGGVEK